MIIALRANGKNKRKQKKILFFLILPIESRYGFLLFSLLALAHISYIEFTFYFSIFVLLPLCQVSS